MAKKMKKVKNMNLGFMEPNFMVTKGRGKKKKSSFQPVLPKPRM